MLSWLKKGAMDTGTIVNAAFEKAVKQTGAALDSDTAKRLKESTVSAMVTAGDIAKNMSDLNGDGKVDAEDLKLAANKAGIAWDSIDPDLKTALLAGGAAGIGVNIIPLVGQAIAIPAFVGTTAYFYIVAKLTKLKVSKSVTSDTVSPPAQKLGGGESVGQADSSGAAGNRPD
jgi:hypothetical protein